ncbi:hypothetical protein ACFLQL_03075 [Verrucomicrobiota bacterium]
MKERAGFVSNSSSSNFILITTEAIHKAVLTSMTKDERKVMAAIEYVFNKLKGHGLPNLIKSELYIPQDNAPEMDDIEVKGLEDICPSEVYEKYTKLVKAKRKCYEWEEELN